MKSFSTSSSSARTGTGKSFESTFSPTKFNRNKAVAPMPLRPNVQLSSSHNTPRVNKNRYNPKLDAASKLNRKTTNIQTEVVFQSILRIRPLTLEEQREKNVFSIHKDDEHIVRLHSLKERPVPSSMSRRQKDIELVAPIEYCFDNVLGDEVTQEDVYKEVHGEVMVRETLDSMFPSGEKGEVKQHVIVSMGVSNSGKTYTIFGDQEHHDDGIVPRLIDDMFSTEKDLNMERRDGTRQLKFGLQLSMVHLHNDHVYDMLSLLDECDHSQTAKTGNALQRRKSNVSKMVESFESRPLRKTDPIMKELKIKQDRQTHDFTINPTIVTCTSPCHARDMLNEGLKNNTTSSTNLNKVSSRGHTIITIRPVFYSREMGQNAAAENIISVGGSINVIDMAGIERTKARVVPGLSMRESVSINTAISAILHCLRSIKNNGDTSLAHHDIDAENLSPSRTSNVMCSEKNSRKSQVVPYRQNKLTMLMQPLFSGKFAGRRNIVKVKTTVRILVSVYPGTKDYNEKKALLSEINSLSGLSTRRTVKRTVNSSNTAFTQSAEKNELQRSEQSCDSSYVTSPKDKVDSNNSDDFSVSKVSSPLKRITMAVKTSSTKKRKAEANKLLERIKLLEEDNRIIRESNRVTKRQLTSLEVENRKLKADLEASKEAEEKVRIEAKRWREVRNSDSNVERFLAAREMRWREQNLLSSPIRHHMNSVEEHRAVYSGNVKGMMMVKPPFQLVVPQEKKTTSSMESNKKNKGNPCGDEDSLGSCSA